MKAFIKIHSACKDTRRKEDHPLSPLEWMQGHDIGISSRTICCTIAGLPWTMNYFSPDVPHYPSDFGRCYRLLQLFPQFKDRLSLVSSRYIEWTPFVREWDKLIAMYEKALESKANTAPEMYQFMKELKKEGYALKKADRK